MNRKIERAYRFMLLCWNAGERAQARVWANRMTSLVKYRNRLEAAND